jgi:hypothetical protein
MADVAQRGCKRCLLGDLADSGDILSQVEKTRKLMTEDERADDKLYEKRLSLCKECDKLIDATCLKCGCYVEIRALAKGASCPGRKW